MPFASLLLCAGALFQTPAVKGWAAHELERQTGWRDLLDPASHAHWRSAGAAKADPGEWELLPFVLRRSGNAASDLVYSLPLRDFELEYRWRLDARGSDAGSMANEWNAARLVVREGRVEGWSNGERVLGSALDDAPVVFGTPVPDRLAVRAANTAMWISNLRLREAPPGEALELVQGDSLAGWSALGDADWSLEAGAIRGRVAGGGQSFLASERSFGDFVLELEFKLHGQGNSGVQVRSRRGEHGRVQGYQIEIDPSPRGWSGGLYDEGRRGWLHDLAERPAARAAFDPQGWNRYRIECVGPWIRSWINDVPAADHFDPLDLEGFLALQVHSGRDTDLTWRGLRLWDLGRRAWEAASAQELLESSEQGQESWTREEDLLVGRPANNSWLPLDPGPVDDFCLRFEFRGAGEAALRLHARSTLGSLAGADPLAPDREPGPLTLLPGGWLLEASTPLLLARSDPQGWTRVSLAAYGERIVLHAGERLLADLRSGPGPRSGSLAFEVRGAGGRVELRRIERLGPAR